jgi:pimeloyl-ACP methyl ester carboxylesterase
LVTVLGCVLIERQLFHSEESTCPPFALKTASKFYKDWGSGQPIVFSHGWPLSADDWDTQLPFFMKHGYRVIAHDRRWHGRSTQTGDGHDMDHYADDLASLTDHLDLKNANPRRAFDRWR